jgi:hypothetical protein
MPQEPGAYQSVGGTFATSLFDLLRQQQVQKMSDAKDAAQTADITAQTQQRQQQVADLQAAKAKGLVDDATFEQTMQSLQAGTPDTPGAPATFGGQGPGSLTLPGPTTPGKPGIPKPIIDLMRLGRKEPGAVPPAVLDTVLNQQYPKPKTPPPRYEDVTAFQGKNGEPLQHDPTTGTYFNTYGQPYTGQVVQTPRTRYEDVTAFQGKNGEPLQHDPTTGTYFDTHGQPYTGQVVHTPKPLSLNLSGLNALYADTDPKAIAASIRAGTSPPDVSQYGRPVQGAVASELAKPGPNGEPPFNLSNAQRTWNSQKRLNATMNGQQQARLDQAIRSGLAMYDKIDTLADQWDGAGLGPLSRANLTIADNGGLGLAAQQKAVELQGQIAQLSSDVAQVEQGGMTPTNESRDVANQSMQAWWGKGTIRSMTAQGRANLNIRQIARAQTEPVVIGNVPPDASTLPGASMGSGTIRVQKPDGTIVEIPATNETAAVKLGGKVIR